jgi:hypothetical protein
MKALRYGLGPITIAIAAGLLISPVNPAPVVMDSSVSLAAKALARSCIAATKGGGAFPAPEYTITPDSGAAAIPACGFRRSRPGIMG